MSKRNENRPRYKKTRVGWIPEEWKCMRLGNIASVTSGGTPRRDEPAYWGGSIPWISTSEIDFNTIGEANEFITDQGLGSSSVRLCPTGTLLMAMFGQGLTRGKVALLGIEACFNQACAAIMPNGNLHSIYLFLYLMGKYHKIRNQSQIGTQANLNAGIIKSLSIPLPPLPEQTKIAEILSAWDRAVEQVGRLINAKQRLKKGLMQQLLTGRMRFPKFGKPIEKKGQLPEVWEEIRAKKMFARRSVKNCGKETVFSVTQNVGVVPRDSLDRKINMTDSNTDTYKLVEPGDSVISLRLFQGGIEYSKHRGIVSSAYHVIRPTVKVDNDFYRHYFKSYEFVGHLAIAVIGIRDGKQISYDDFAYMRFPYPPVPEQSRIAAVLSTCDREIELLRKKQEKLREQKKGLMQKLLTGEIRHPEFLKEGKI